MTPSARSPRPARPGRSERRHASCVRWLERGILLLGPSGAGKSDLALRLIEAGGRLVADDLVQIERQGARLVARAVALAGHIELRGQGIYRLPTEAEATLDQVVRLVPGGAVERLPPPVSEAILGVALPALTLDPHQPSAVARLRVALLAQRVDTP